MKALTYNQAVEILTNNKGAYLDKIYTGFTYANLFDGTQNQSVSEVTFEKLLASGLLKPAGTQRSPIYILA